MKKVVIIGGGVAGLSAGIFAQKNGFESVILEKHHTFGGECAGWNRQGYHIDGCIHWLVGTKADTPIRKLWDTVGALDGVDIHEPESFMAVEHDGFIVNFYRDLERLESSWLEISPEDKDIIQEFSRDIKKLHSFSFPVGKPMDMMNIIEKFKYFLSMKDIGTIMQKYDKISVQEFAKKFKHPALREALASFMPEGDYSSSSLIFPLGTFTGGQSSIPKGGSKALALRMAERYLSLGGIVEASCEVMDLDIEDDMVTRISCKNGKSFQADYVIAACDAHVLYERLLKGRYPDSEYQKRFNNPTVYPLASNIYIGIGYEGTMEDIPRTLKFNVNNVDINQNQKPIEHLQMTHYAYEPEFAPKGHTVITLAVNQFQPELDFWEALVIDNEAYAREKERIGRAVIHAMETRFPRMKGKLKLLDVASPQTYNRYCNAYRGAFMAFWPTLRGKSLVHTGRIEGLTNIVLSGQWLQPPGGLPVALITGKDTIMRLCKKEKQPFTGV
ncbi:phytoene desaturase family protein [Candidatus Contubernalis alkaliaceticus]|uniref:phytoene desaturase family protein n=1 Tax=Candidatus Contubernalis alkaliaceticus TaxID=338645 RepID=UPI001F4C2038|nr:FAD-dependent oxidoreductase [Candidatus Contubernalis alkalaceticus]UNC92317.1 NAD(P)/FAD-dependent oxidoreductase [Candidatus Contubernalis alkalaceticus]